MFSCTRTGANSFLLVWWKGGVERNGVSLPHVPEPFVPCRTETRGGETQCFSRTRAGVHSVFIWNQEEVGKNGVHLDLVL